MRSFGVSAGARGSGKHGAAVQDAVPEQVPAAEGGGAGGPPGHCPPAGMPGSRGRGLREVARPGQPLQSVTHPPGPHARYTDAIKEPTFGGPVWVLLQKAL